MAGVTTPGHSLRRNGRARLLVFVALFLAQASAEPAQHGQPQQGGALEEDSLISLMTQLRVDQKSADSMEHALKGDIDSSAGPEVATASKDAAEESRSGDAVATQLLASQANVQSPHGDFASSSAVVTEESARPDISTQAGDSNFASLLQKPAASTSGSACTDLSAADTKALESVGSDGMGVLGMAVAAAALILGTIHIGLTVRDTRALSPALQQAETVLLVLTAATSSMSWLVADGYVQKLHALLWAEVCLKPSVVVSQILRNCALRWASRSYNIKIELARRMDMSQRQTEAADGLTAGIDGQAAPFSTGRSADTSALLKAAVMWLLLAAVTAALQFGGAECMGLSAGGTVALMATQIGVCVVQLIVFLLVKSVREAFFVQRELFATAAANFGACGALLAFTQLAMMSGGGQPTVAWIDAARFANPCIVLVVLSVRLACALARRGNLGAGDTKGFDEMFASDSARRVFGAYLDMEFSAELFLFWQHVEEYKDAFNESEGSEEEGSQRGKAQSALRRDMVRKAKMGIMARNIFNKYIVSRAVLDIKVPATLQGEIGQRINSNTISPNMFDAAQNHVYERMRDSFGRFRRHSDSQRQLKHSLPKDIHHDGRDWQIL